MYWSIGMGGKACISFADSSGGSAFKSFLGYLDELLQRSRVHRTLSKYEKL